MERTSSESVENEAFEAMVITRMLGDGGILILEVKES